MSSLALTSIFNLRRQRARGCRLLLLVDPAVGVDSQTVVRWLTPWRNWLTVVASATGTPEALLELCGSAVAADCDACMIVSSNWHVVAAVSALAARRQIACATPALPPDGSRELGLLQEVMHHDVELGGWNTWTTGDSQYGASVLRLLSRENSRLVFPTYVMPFLLPDGRPLAGGRRLRALDVGCGSLSHLRWGALQGWLSITGVDPLLDMYAVVRERHGVSDLPHVQCDAEICSPAEELDVVELAGAFDLVLCVNALDHTEDPFAIVRHIATVLKPGGVAALQTYTREGSREAWWQLHQFDMFMEGDRFMAQARDGAPQALIDDASDLEVVQVVNNSDQITGLVARKRAAAR